MKKATLAPDEILRKYDAVSIANENNDIGLVFKGWTFIARHEKICTSNELITAARHIERVTLSYNDTNVIKNNPELSNFDQTRSSGDDHLKASTARQLSSIVDGSNMQDRPILATQDDNDNIRIGCHSLNLPPMLFLHDFFSITHNQSNIQISMRSLDAITAWALHHNAKYQSHRPLKVTLVPYAQTWSERSLPGVNSDIKFSNRNSCSNSDKHIDAVSSDLNETNALSGDITLESSIPIYHQAASTSTIGDFLSTNTQSLIGTAPKWDWTYCSDYCCTVTANVPTSTCNDTRACARIAILSGTILADAPNSMSLYSALAYESVPQLVTQFSQQSHQHRHQQQSSHKTTQWKWTCEAASQSGLDMNLLRATGSDAPILLYDEFTLYQDDLEDCGESLCECKFRLVPTCWLLLTRMFVRIDGAEASLKETRLFHAFPPLTSHSSCSGSVTDPIEATRPEPVVVHMVITWKEMSLTASGNDDGTFASLPHRNKGMHSGTSSIPQAHCRPLGTTGASGFTRNIMRTATDLSEMMTQVNEKYNVPQYYTLIFTPIS